MKRRRIRERIRTKSGSLRPIVEPLSDFSGAAEAASEGERLSLDLKENLAALRLRWANCSDVSYREFTVQNTPVALVWIRTLIGSTEVAQDSIVDPLMRTTQTLSRIEDIGQVLTAIQTTPIQTVSQVIQMIADGLAVVMVDGLDEAVAIAVGSLLDRQVMKPELEPGVLGPQEAFTESLDKNLGLMRRRLKTPRFKVELVRLGTISNTQIAILYLEGVANPKLVREFKERLAKIQIDGTLDINYISELTRDAIRSPFPTDQITERPDRTAAALLQGRIAGILDGSPYAMLIPALFVLFLSSSEDYYSSYTIAVPVRLLRQITYWLSLLLPALYVALMSYHQEMIPTALLIKLASTHEGIPFPAVIEAFIMIATFEALREAGIRLPKAVGQSVSIVGALVIGDAAVNAGIVSPGMVIVVALTGVASFSIPSYHLALANRVLQFPFLILAGLFGLYGITIGLLILLIHLLSIRSYGVPYMSPFAPFDWKALKSDVFARSAWWDMKQRPKVYEPADLNRNASPRPSPPTRGSKS